MARAADGRRVGARRNGWCFVSIQDDRGCQFTLDYAHALELADALENGQAYTTSGCAERALEFTGTRLGKQGDEAYTGPQRGVLSGPWELDEAQRTKLAAEIRRAANG